MTEEKKTNIRKRPREFVKFLGVEYHIYSKGVCPREIAGDVLQDLIEAMYYNTEPKFEANKRAILESDDYIANKKEKIQEWRKKKFGEKKPDKESMDLGLFKNSYPDNWREIERHELEKIMLAAGISPDKFFRWHEDTSANGWLDGYGNPIRDPIAACRAYSKHSSQQKPEEV
jgi:hypothetical protein